VYLLRYNNITTIQSILLICKLVFGVFASVSSIWLFGHGSWQDNIVRAINAYLAAFFLYCFVWKFWLLRYNIMLNNVVIGAEWKSIINHKKYVANKTFYAKYKRTWGNLACTMWMCVTLAVLFTTIFVLTNYVFPDTYTDADIDTNIYLEELYAGWDYAIPFLLLLAIYVKTPSFDDNFYICQEMTFIFGCLCVQYASYYTYLVVMAIVFHNSSNDFVEDLTFFVEFQVVIAMQFTAMMVSTYWVNKQCDDIIAMHRYQIHKISDKLELNLQQKHCVEIVPKPDADALHKFAKTSSVGSSFSARHQLQQQHNGYRKHTGSSINGIGIGGGIAGGGGGTGDDHADTDTFDDYNMIMQSATNINCNTYRDGLYDILSLGATFTEFMKHLSLEFSVECLLSLTEMVQFRDYMLRQAQTEEQEEEEEQADNVAVKVKLHKSSLSFTDELQVELPKDIPHSYIVENEQWSNKEKAHRLYSKYIENGSELEINISADQRSFYDDMLSDYEAFMTNENICDRDLVNLFVPCCAQMIYLMIDSRKRFEATPVFSKLQKMYNTRTTVCSPRS